MKRKVSLRVIRRISFYYEALLKLNLPEDTYVSSKKLEEITGVSCNQVRQDFFYLGISIGKQKKGYQVKKLFAELRRVLSIDRGADVVVIGAGRLGCALAQYKIFKVRNINVTALFDIDPNLVGRELEVKNKKLPILHMNDLETYLKKHPEIKIAVLAVPEEAAQDTLDKLIELGFLGIVNFAPRILKLPRSAEDVQLVNDCIGASLYKIIYQIYNQEEETK